MTVPDSLRERLEIYQGTGRIRIRSGELFTDLSWFYIFEGLGVRPNGHDPLLDVVPEGKLSEILASLAHATRTVVEAAPAHDSYFQ
jgi:tryptophan halogenase